MRCLIIDDDPQKVTLLKAELIDSGVAADDVLVAEDASKARRILSDQVFDVMLIDVLLPSRAGAVPNGATSLELLNQIIDDGTPHAPKHIVGITASTEAVSEHEQDFRNLTLQIIHVAPPSQEWKVSIKNLVRFVKRAEASENAFDYDICILNALRKPELEAVHATWPMTLSPEQLLRRNVLYQSGTLNLSSGTKRIVCAHLSQVGPVSAAQAAESLLQEFRPRVMIMTGICGGFSDHVQVGDLVVADKSWDWQAGKWTDEGTLLTSPDQKEAARELIAISQLVEGGLASFHSTFVGNRPEVPPNLVIGPMVTGSSVVASTEIQRVFRQQHRKMVAIDMECYGIYYAAALSGGPQSKVVCIKAVSDLADRSKSDDFHNYCSQLSAWFGFNVVRKYFETLPTN